MEAFEKKNVGALGRLAQLWGIEHGWVATLRPTWRETRAVFIFFRKRKINDYCSSSPNDLSLIASRAFHDLSHCLVHTLRHKRGIVASSISKPIYPTEAGPIHPNRLQASSNGTADIKWIRRHKPYTPRVIFLAGHLDQVLVHGRVGLEHLEWLHTNDLGRRQQPRRLGQRRRSRH